MYLVYCICSRELIKKLYVYHAIKYVFFLYIILFIYLRNIPEFVILILIGDLDDLKVQYEIQYEKK